METKESQKQLSLHLTIEHCEYVTTHQLAERLAKLGRMLGRLPNVPCTQVQLYSEGGLDVYLQDDTEVNEGR